MKIIKSFNLDLTNIHADGERRRFTILGDNKADFKLEIKDSTTGYYYNFVTGLFGVEQRSLERSIVGPVHCSLYLDCTKKFWETKNAEI